MILEAINKCIFQNEDFATGCINIINEIYEQAQNFFYNQNDNIINLVKRINNSKNFERQTKRQAIDALLQMVQAYADNLTSQNTKDIIELIILDMNQIELTEEWQNPPDDFNEELEDMEHYQYGITSLDSLLQYTDDQTIDLLLSFIINCFDNEKWQMQYSSIMALSQLGEYMTDKQNLLDPIIAALDNKLKSPNPMVRYATLHCIGQLSSDIPQFQNNNFEKLFPLILQLIYDSVPRVQSHAASCLTNYIDGLSPYLLNQYLEPILKQCIYCVENSKTFVKESCISAITSVLINNQPNFKQYVNEILQIIFSLYEKNNKEFQIKLRGVIIEFLSFVCMYFMEEFKQYVDLFLSKMIEIQLYSFDSLQITMKYIIQGYQRICMNFADKLPPHLNQIIPWLIKVAKQIFEQNQLFNEDSNLAIQLITNIISFMKEQFIPFFDQTQSLIDFMFTYKQYNQEFRNTIAKCQIALIENTQLQQPPNNLNIPFQILIKYCQKFDAQQKMRGKVVIDLSIIKKCLIIPNVMNQQQLEMFYNDFFPKVMEVYKNSVQFYFDCIEKTNQQIDQILKQQYESQLKQEESLQMHIINFVSELMKFHLEFNQRVALYLIENVVKKLVNSQLDFQNKLAIIIINSILQFVELSKIENVYNQLEEVVVKFSLSSNITIRNFAQIGIYRIIQTINMDQLLAKYQQYVKLIDIAINIQQPTATQFIEYHFKTRDQSIMNLGQIINKLIEFQIYEKFNHKQMFDEILSRYLLYCPVNQDKHILLLQGTQLNQLIFENKALIYGLNYINAPQIFRILSDIICQNIFTQPLKEGILKNLLAIQQDVDLFNILKLQENSIQENLSNFYTQFLPK